MKAVQKSSLLLFRELADVMPYKISSVTNCRNRISSLSAAQFVGRGERVTS